MHHSQHSIRDISHFLFDCPKLSPKRANLISYFNYANVPFNNQHIFLSQHYITYLIFLFRNRSGFIIKLFE